MNETRKNIWFDPAHDPVVRQAATNAHQYFQDRLAENLAQSMGALQQLRDRQSQTN